MQLSVDLPDLATMPGVEHEPRNNKSWKHLDYVEWCLQSKDWNEASANLIDLFNNLNIDLDLPWVKGVFHYLKYYKSHKKPNFEFLPDGYKVYYTDAPTHYRASLEHSIEHLRQLPDREELAIGQYDRGMDVDPVPIHNSFESLGILRRASAYLGKDVKVDRAFLHVARPTDKNPYQFFQDLESKPRWTNAHFDPKENTMKAIVYLDHVNMGNGEFSYMPFSNTFSYSHCQNLFARSISTKSYCSDPEQRSSVFKLPSELRVSANFGRLAQPGTQLERFLNNNMHSFIGNGKIILFDPNGWHQGGVVQEGERVCLQILMR